eukprot:TRINITY_DN4479_c0_g1_i1.p1 TRINITY_DN4479_c0_g1~~TRINITY_DN4479_c0_g1_i1.p1  ORF type:complete len:434 (-),score=67.97 TRINITY_DN4479_c0_g1_i1:137-1438(-)
MALAMMSMRMMRSTSVLSPTITRRNLGHEANACQRLYEKKLTDGSLKPDRQQAEAVVQLNELGERLRGYRVGGRRRGRAATPTSGGMFSWMSSSSSSSTQSTPAVTPPKGLYMYGDVGSGKTMLMDLLLESLEQGQPNSSLRKNRVHFNTFMNQIHSSIHEWRQTPESKTQSKDSLILSLAAKVVEVSPVLFFDEFQVTDIANAMILGRLFEAMWNQGAVIVSTSNRPPSDLYLDGLQRDLFLPTIAALGERNVVYNIDSSTDYRLTGEKMSHVFQVGKGGKSALDTLWNELTEGRKGEEKLLAIPGQGRNVMVPETLKGIARFSFKYLCESNFGSADYAAIAVTYHTVFLDEVPQLNATNRNEARRFIVLIDELYNHQTKLLCSLAAEPHLLFEATDDLSAQEEVFMFNRAASRMSEMSTKEYLAKKHLKEP